MKTKIILIIFLLVFTFFFISFVSAFTQTYNFNSTYEQYMNATKCSFDSTTPAGEGPIPICDGTITDFTSDSALDADDISYYSMTTAGNNGWNLYVLNLSSVVNKSDVINLSTTYIVNYHNQQYAYVYAWNSSSSSWKQLSALSYDDDYNSYTTLLNNNDYNTNNKVYILMQTTSSFTHFLIDYISFSVTYDGIIINPPITNQEILNNLSTTLNTSQAEYNNTIWYTWNKGISNNTLCTKSLECQGTITFPRQGYYNLTVYGNKSDGTQTSKDIVNLFVGNVASNNIADTLEDIYAWQNFGGASSAEVVQSKFNITMMNNSHVSNASLFFWIKNGSCPPESKTSSAYYINNENWIDSNINAATYNAMTTSNYIAGFMSSTSTDTWSYISVTNIVQQGINNLNKNITVRFFSNDSQASISTASNIFNDNPMQIGVGSSSGCSTRNELWINSSETTGAPYINVTYYRIINIAPTLTNILANSSNFSVPTVNFTFNISDDNDYLSNISLILDGIRNTTIYNQLITVSINNSLNISVSGIANGLHTWYIQAYDSDGAQSNSSIFYFLIDVTPPFLTITSPTNGQSFTSSPIDLNYTVSDSGVGLSSCWYQNNSGNNITIACGTNTTISQASDGTYTINVWANDTLNNVVKVSHIWSVNSVAPSINLDFPSINAWLNYKNNIYFNYTATDSDGLSSCELWSNWTGSWIKNYTWLSPNSGVQNFTIINLTDGFYEWNVWCNDSASPNKNNWATLNRTVGIDTIYPASFNISISPTTGSQTISFSVNVSDINLNTCKYSIFNSSNSIDGLNNNISVSCSSLGNSATVSNYGTYNLTFYAIDKAGNENSSTQSFKTSALISQTFLGGAGGSPVTNRTWELLTEDNGKTYTFSMTSGSSRTGKIKLNNLGTTEKVITISCTGQLCNYLSLVDTQVTLPIGLTIPTLIDFTVNIPTSVNDIRLSGNIIATDEEGNTDLITIKSNVGRVNIFSDLLNKFKLSREIFNLRIPYVFLIFIIFIFLLLMFSLVFRLFNIKKIGVALNFVLSFIISIVILYFI